MNTIYATELDPAVLARFRAVEGNVATLSEQFDLFRSTRLSEYQLQPNSIGTQQLQIDSILARHIAVDTLSAISADMGTLTAGNITFDSAGFLRGGATAYNTGTGFWAGYDIAAYKMFIGAAAGNKLLWDGTTLAVVGSITATTGAIGGFDIGADYIRDVSNSMGLASTVTGGDDVRFWAGVTFANRATAPFFVTEAGNITANSATIVGTISGRSTAIVASTINSAGNVVTDLINARLDSSAKTMLADFTFGAADYSGALKSGTITWNTTTGALTGGSGVLVYRGGIIGAAAGVAKFTLDAATGAATFAGALSAPTGTIGGWTINSTTITGTNSTLDSAGVLTLGTANDVFIASAADATYRLWIGHATAASGPFRVTKAGALTATSATISGTITSTSGTIGGFTLGTPSIIGSGTGSNYIEIASDVAGKTFGIKLGEQGTAVRNTFVNAGRITMTYPGTGGNNHDGVTLYADTAATGAGVVELRKNDSATVNVLLRGDTGDGTFVGTVRANTAFNHDGTAGATGTIDIATTSFIFVSGGIITSWS